MMKSILLHEKNDLRRILFFVLSALMVLNTGQDAFAAEVTVVIDPGHGGDPEEAEENGGAHYQNVYEKDLNLIVADAMAEELRQYQGVSVYQTRTEDTKLELEERASFAKNKNADVLIGIHFNASQKHLFYGAEVWTSMFGRYYAEGYSLGNCILEQFEQQGLVNRGVKTRKGKTDEDYYGLIRHGVHEDIPTIIVEHCYLDDEEEYETYADSREKLELFGKHDAAAVAAYYGLNKETPPESIQKAVTIPVMEAPVLPDDTPPEDVVLTLQEYDATAGIVKAVISAVEKQSRLLYYGYSLDGGESFSRLFLWDDKDGTCQVEIPVEKGFSGEIQAVVYNNFNQDTCSNLVTVSIPRKETDEKEGMTEYDLLDAYEISQNEPEQPMTGTDLPAQAWSVYEILLLVFLILFLLLLSAFVGLLILMRRQNRRRRH